MKEIFIRHTSTIAILTVALSAGCASTNSRLQPRQAAANSEQIAHPVLLDEPTSRSSTLASGIYNWKDLAVRSSDFGEQRSVFRSPTATLDEMEVHITVLKPGQRPHPPHRHPYEEMIFVKEGTLEVSINDHTSTLAAGGVLFVAPNDLHGWRNSGSTPATYFVLSWHTPRTQVVK